MVDFKKMLTEEYRKEHKRGLTVAISGSRVLNVGHVVVKALERGLLRVPMSPPIRHVFVGDCRTGVDAIALDWLKRSAFRSSFRVFCASRPNFNSLTVEGIPAVLAADWDRDGKHAGFARNHVMLLGVDALVAVWDGQSRGTEHAIRTAEELGIPVYMEQLNV